MNRPKAVIFDFDGVLVDSEWIANRIEAEFKTELGFPTTAEEQIRRFTGLGAENAVVLAELERMPPAYLEQVDERIVSAYRRELKPIDGVIKMLSSFPLPKCVASNSDAISLAFKLELTRLDRFFENAAFSASTVGIGKPAPDLFQYAMRTMGWQPEDVWVLEDSLAGVHAAKAAGLTVYGFLGGKHILPGHAESLLKAGVAGLISRHEEFVALLQ